MNAPAGVDEVWEMDEGGGVVVKTGGGVEVAQEGLTWWLSLRPTDEMAPRSWLWGIDSPAAIGEYVERMRYRDDWWRWNPCHPRSCFDGTQHRPGHLERAAGPGRGVWRGVLVERP